MKQIHSSVWSHIIAQRRAGAALAILSLALTIVASLIIIGSTSRAETVQGSAFDTGEKADPVAIRKGDLESLKARPAAVAAIGRSVYEEASRILNRLARSNFPDEKMRADAVIALREVVKLSHRLAAASEVLADAAETAATGQLAGSAAQMRVLGEFDIARKVLERSADELLKQFHRVRSYEVKRESLAEEIADLSVDLSETKPDQSAVFQLEMLKHEAVEQEKAELQALIRSVRPFEADQRALMAAISELAPLLAPPVERAAPTPGVSLSVYGFFDEQGPEEEGYGLYTYVLLAAPPGTGRRNAAFLRELLASTGRTSGELAAVRRQLNIFYVPTQNRIQALVIARSSAEAATAIAAPSVYDYQRAERLLVRVCTESIPSNPRLCASAWRGPYLLTLSEPLGTAAAMSPTHLVVDLSGIHERAFGEFIRAVKEQVMRRDFTDRQKVDALRLQILDITLKAADWLDPIKEGIAEIVFFEGDAAR